MTAHPTAEWTGQQLRDAFPFDQLPRYLLRDRDAIFGNAFRGQGRDMGTHEVLSTPRSPWQRAYVERVIGSFVVITKEPFCCDSRYVAFVQITQRWNCLHGLERHITDRGSKTP